MARDLTLSEEVQTYIDTLDWEYDRELSPEERPEAAKAKKIVEVIVPRSSKPAKSLLRTS